MLKKWFISAFPEIQKISQNLGPKLGQKLLKIESSMKRCIGSVKPHRTVFHFFARYYDAKEMIHTSVFPKIQKISQNLGPNLGQKLKNWIFNEKVHRIRESSQNRFSLFRKNITMLKKWFISAFPEIQKISQNLGPNLGQKL